MRRVLLQWACVWVTLGLVGCGEDSLGTRMDGGATDAPREDSATEDAGSTDGGDTVDDVGTGTDAPMFDAPEVAPRACVYRSATFDASPRELDVMRGSTTVLAFDVAGLPDPSLIDSARLQFTSYDADHPGEEGVIRIAGSEFDLPAMSAWDNADGTGDVEITGATVAGDNRIEFGAGPLDRSFFRIGAVQIVAMARVVECVSPPDPPDPTAVRRTMHFSEASYTNRGTWVVPCPPGHPSHNALRNYAFTASGDEHDPTDCDGGYMPGGSRRGTAVFHFDAVVRARYRVVIRSRHTENRNPAHALFVVDGEERRIDQTTSDAYEDDVWGERMLEGTVDVVLDSTREGNSDAVTSVTLEPIAG